MDHQYDKIWCLDDVCILGKSEASGAYTGGACKGKACEALFRMLKANEIGYVSKDKEKRS